MGFFDFRQNPAQPPVPSALAGNVPSACPTCQSQAIVTAAKTPDASTYWRCTSCGDVWNDSRCHEQQARDRRWR